MTVFENVLVAATPRRRPSRGERPIERCVDALELCDMLHVANRRAETLGLLDRKRLELARALATDPAVLLLDEIGGGLTDEEAEQLVETIRSCAAAAWPSSGSSTSSTFSCRVVERLVCMDAGRIIADGKPETVIADAAVVDAYLGGAAHDMSLLDASNDLDARHGLLQAVRGVIVRDRKGRDRRAGRRQRRGQDDAAARDRRRASCRPRPHRIRRRRRHRRARP